MKTLEHRAKKRRKNRESGKMADKKMDENRGKQNWKLRRETQAFNRFAFSRPMQISVVSPTTDEVDKVDFAYIEKVSTRRLIMYIFPFLSTVG